MTPIKTRMEIEYEKHMDRLVAYAQPIVGDEAEDIAHEAFYEVMDLPELREGEIGGLLMQRVKWRAADFLRRREAVLEADLGEVDDDGESMRPMQLDDLEATQLHHGSIPPWPTAIDHDSPEEIVTAAQMRDKIAEVVRDKCGPDDYGMFMAIADGVDQSRVAKEWRVDQATVSRAVARVRNVVSDFLDESRPTDRESESHE